LRAADGARKLPESFAFCPATSDRIDLRAVRAITARRSRNQDQMSNHQRNFGGIEGFTPRCKDSKKTEECKDLPVTISTGLAFFVAWREIWEACHFKN
jgi:hypothetical protein